jgi:hypothetical protein
LATDFEKEMDNEITKILKNSAMSIKSDTNSKFQKNTTLEEEEEDTDSDKELETGMRATIKRPHFTNDELLYDPNMDDDDQNWMNKLRKT